MKLFKHRKFLSYSFGIGYKLICYHIINHAPITSGKIPKAVRCIKNERRKAFFVLK